VGARPMSKRVSILMPVYNGARFLDEQVRSILAQTHGDFELLAYDDGSTDDSLAILRRHAEADPRMRVVAGGENMGQNAALKTLFA
jgi:glycosyltransferase involved in cell wall biosynthesis